MSEELNMKVDFVPYQLCPKCNGQGTVQKPPHIGGDVFEWTSTELLYQCDVCFGAKIIPMHILTNQDIISKP